MKFFAFFLCSASLCLVQAAVVPTAFSAAPMEVNYQGYLEDSSGAPLEGDQLIHFYLYGVDTGGTPVWDEQQTVPVNNGIFNVILGSQPGSPLLAGHFTGPDLYLELEIFKSGSGWETLAPRQKITSSPFAVTALNAGTLAGFGPEHFSEAGHEHDAAYVNEGQAASVTGAMIQDSSVGAAKLEADSVDASKISAGAVTSSELADKSVTLSKMANDSVSSSEVIDESLTFEDIKDGSGSKLDADALDGYDSSYFMAASVDKWVNTAGDTMNGDLNVSGAKLSVTGTSTAMSDYVASFQSIGEQAFAIKGTASADTYYAQGLELDVDAQSYAKGLVMDTVSAQSYAYGVQASAQAGADSSSTVRGWYGQVSHHGTGDLYGLYNRSSHYGAGGSAFGLFSYIVGSDTGDALGVYSEAQKDTTDTSGEAWGGRFRGINYRDGGESYGIMGEALGADSNRYGVYGKTSVTNSSYGSSHGVYAEALSDAGFVYGFRANVDVPGNAYGRGLYIEVDKPADDASGGLYGVGSFVSNQASTGESYGLYNSVSGKSSVRGIYTYAYSSESPAWGIQVIASSSSSSSHGVWGVLSDANHAVSGPAYGGLFSTTAYIGDSGDGYGIKAVADGDTSGKTYGGYFQTTGSGTYDYAGYFVGKVHVAGTLSKAGGSFIIDHPLDPENKILQHSFVESPDMKNVYDGTVLLDETGESWVLLPDYFEALNKDFRYQLTPVGSPGPGLYIAEEIKDNRFKISGGSPGMKVSWQVTGIRKDAWAEANRIQVEREKSEEEKGSYLNPEAFGLDGSFGMDARAEEKEKPESAVFPLNRD